MVPSMRPAVDGAGPFTLWARVGLPLVRPVTAAVAVLAFSVTWSNVVDPLLSLFDERLETLPLGVRALSTLDRSDLPLLLAGAAVTTLPALLALVLTEGGPPPSSTTYLPLVVDRNGFEYLRYGYAAAATLVLFAITALVVAVQWRLVRRRRLDAATA